MRAQILRLAAATVVAWFALPGIAFASPQVIASDPAQASEEHEAPEEVSVTFDMILDPEASTLTVVDECGRHIDDGEPEVLGNMIRVGIAETPSGIYEMRYKATPPAGATGSSRGAIRFTVHAGKACEPSQRSGHGSHSGQGPAGEQPGGSHDGHTPGGAGTHPSGQGGATHEMSAGSTATHTQHSAGGSSDSAVKPANHDNSRQGPPRPTVHSDHPVQAAPPLALPVSGTPLSAQGGALLAAILLCAAIGAGGGYIARQSGRSQAPQAVRDR